MQRPAAARSRAVDLRSLRNIDACNLLRAFTNLSGSEREEEPLKASIMFAYSPAMRCDATGWLHMHGDW